MTAERNSEAIQSTRVWNQYLATITGIYCFNLLINLQISIENVSFFMFIANIILVSFGSIVGWPSSGLSVLTSDTKSHLIDGALNNEQASWVGELIIFIEKLRQNKK